MPKAYDSNDLYQLRKDSIEAKTLSLNECTFVSSKDIWEPKIVGDSSVPIYSLSVRVSPKDFNEVSRQVDEAVRLVGKETYFFDKPDNWDKLTWQQQDEIRFTDQYNKTGVLPIYNPVTNSYLVPKAQDFVLSSPDLRQIYSRSIVAPKVIGDAKEGDNLNGRECSVRGNIRVFDNGRIYFSAREITVFAGNSVDEETF